MSPINIHKTKKYVLSGGTHTKQEADGSIVTYRSGETLNLTKEEAESPLIKHRIKPFHQEDEEGSSSGMPGQFFPSTTTPVEADTNPGEEALTGPPEGDPNAGADEDSSFDWSSIGDLSAPDAANAFNSLTSANDVKAALKAEKAGKARKSVIAAGESRLELLKKG